MGFLIKTEALPVDTRVRVYDAVTRGALSGTIIRSTANKVSVRLDETLVTAFGTTDVMIFTLRASGRWIRRYQPDAWDSLRVWRMIATEED